MKRKLLFALVLGLSSSFALAHEQREKCVDQAIEDLGIDMQQASDPTLLKAVLKDDMFLADLPAVLQVLGSKLEKSESMAPMLSAMRQGIVDKHPAVADFLCAAHDQGLLQKGDFTRVLHHMFLFEEIINGMVKDWHLMNDVYHSLLKKRANYGIRDGFAGSMIDILKAGGGLFGSVKAKTMDAVFKMYAESRERGEITEAEIADRKKTLRINIMEAYSTDRVHGHRSNAFAGLALGTVPPDDVQLEGPERRILYVYDQEWTSLYQTWNLAFISGNLANLNLLYPKLLIPAVANAEPSDYLFNRCLALWLSVNFYLFAKLEHRPDVVLPNAKKIAELWGEINYKYAMTYMNRMSHKYWRSYFLLKKMSFDTIVSDDLHWLFDVAQEPEL